MSTNLIETVTSYLTPDVINKTSAFLHESPANTSIAVSSIIPVLLGRITNMVSSPGGSMQLAGLLSSGGHDGSILNNVGGLFTGGRATSSVIHEGEGLLNTLFGNKVDSVTSAVSGFSGIGKGSAASLMALAAPLVMGVIGRMRSTQSLNPTDLANVLSSQKATIATAMPAELANLTNDYDVQGLRSVTVAPMTVQDTGGGTKRWPLLLLLAIALGFLAYLFGRGRPSVSTAAALAQVKLCSGNTLALTTGSFNYKLARYLADGSNADLPKTFVFDNLNFDSATTNLTPPSRQTVDDLIVILNACPDAQVQLAGHTDNTGDPAGNQALSSSRASAIKDMLAAGGIAADRMTTVGYGQDKPIASNDTEDGKARNRRTELVVLKR